LLFNTEIPTIVVNTALHARSVFYVFFETYLFRGGLSIPSILCMLSHHSLKCVKKKYLKNLEFKIDIDQISNPRKSIEFAKKISDNFRGNRQAN